MMGLEDEGKSARRGMMGRGEESDLKVSFVFLGENRCSVAKVESGGFEVG